MDKQIEIKDMEPWKLFTHRRFDLLAKYIYGKYRDQGIKSDWHRRLYLDHISLANGFVEADGSGKCGRNNFMNVFNSVLDSIKTGGFDEKLPPVPITVENYPIDGSHRVAACMLYGKTLKCAVGGSKANYYDSGWWKKIGLPDKWLDAMALELCRIKKDCFVVVIYPAANGKDEELEKLIQGYGQIWHRKAVYLKKQGPLNLIRQIYYKESWTGNWKNGFAGAQSKANWCFQREGPVRLFIIESALPEMRELKVRIRDLYRIENHAVHINDTWDEALHLAEIFFNENSIHFLNHCAIREFKWFNRLLKHYKEWLDKSGANRERFCIDGSSVLAAYGLREARDLDFLHLDENVITDFREISSHNEEAHLYGTTVDDIILNPENHFYYSGLKFASLNAIMGMKRRRGEYKDIEDLRLITNRLSETRGRLSIPINIRAKQFLSARFIYQKMRFTALQARFMLTVLKNKRLSLR